LGFPRHFGPAEKRIFGDAIKTQIVGGRLESRAFFVVREDQSGNQRGSVMEKYGPANCPKCSEPVDSLIKRSVPAVDAETLDDPAWKAVTLQCPNCNAFLGCQLDPTAIKEATIDAIKEEIRHLRRS